MRLSLDERALVRAFFADLAMAVPIIGLGFMSGSASGTGEAIRATLLYVIDIFSLTILLAINRRKFSQFEFGLEKIQILVQIAIAAGMGLSAVFIGSRIIANLTTDIETPNYVICLLFAGFSYINVMINVACLRGMVRANRSDGSIILRSQIRNRIIMLASSVAVTISTAAVVIPDPELFALIDSIGAIFVLGAILYTMVTMLTSSVLTLLDAPIDERDKLVVVREIVDQFDNWSSVPFIRTRRVGYHKYIEIGLSFDDGAPLQTAFETCRAVEDAIKQKVEHAFVSVFPAKAPEPGSPDALSMAG